MGKSSGFAAAFFPSPANASHSWQSQAAEPSGGLDPQSPRTMLVKQSSKPKSINKKSPQKYVIFTAGRNLI